MGRTAEEDIASCEAFLTSLYKNTHSPRERSAAIYGYKMGILRHDGSNWLLVSSYLDDIQEMQIYYRSAA